MLRMTVTDNGPGVDPAVAARMFRPFFTTKARGTGLGLALVQKIVVTHNGRVTRRQRRRRRSLPDGHAAAPTRPDLDAFRQNC